MREPGSGSPVTVRGALQLAPPSVDDASRRVANGNRRPSITLATAYSVYSVPSGAYAIFGGASPCGSMPPSESRSSAGGEPLVVTKSRPSVPPPGAETQAIVRAPAGESANIGAAPTSVDALNTSGASSSTRAPGAHPATVSAPTNPTSSARRRIVAPVIAATSSAPRRRSFAGFRA